MSGTLHFLNRRFHEKMSFEIFSSKSSKAEKFKCKRCPDMRRFDFLIPDICYPGLVIEHFQKTQLKKISLQKNLRAFLALNVPELFEALSNKLNVPEFFEAYFLFCL